MKHIFLRHSVKLAGMVSTVRNETTRFVKKQDGVTAIEYAVIAVAISTMLLAVFGSGDGSFISAITDKFSDLSTNIKGTVPK